MSEELVISGAVLDSMVGSGEETGSEEDLKALSCSGVDTGTLQGSGAF